MAECVDTDVYPALRACRLWRDAGDSAVRSLTTRAGILAFADGEQVAVEGCAANNFGVVISGKARVYQLSPDGRRLTMEVAGCGEPVLAVAALAGGRNPANVEAVGDLRLAWLPKAAIFELIGEAPEAARAIVADLANRVLRLTAMVQSLSLDVPARLARFLFERSLASGVKTGEGLKIDLGMSKAALAEALGTVPETLSRSLARLRREGLIETKGRSIIVLDVGGLARRGAGYEEG